jgi:hypothetical protein
LFAQYQAKAEQYGPARGKGKCPQHNSGQRRQERQVVVVQICSAFELTVAEAFYPALPLWRG